MVGFVMFCVKFNTLLKLYNPFELTGVSTVSKVIKYRVSQNYTFFFQKNGVMPGVSEHVAPSFVDMYVHCTKTIPR